MQPITKPPAVPRNVLSIKLTATPTGKPSFKKSPTRAPSSKSTVAPSVQPITKPPAVPTTLPSCRPSTVPTGKLSSKKSPNRAPSIKRTVVIPTTKPTSALPSVIPKVVPPTSSAPFQPSLSLQTGVPEAFAVSGLRTSPPVIPRSQRKKPVQL